MEIIPYLRFCPPESLFFEVPALDGGRFPHTDASPPSGWTRHVDSEWVNILSPTPLPFQGWKVHVSSTPGSAEEVLETCWSFCVDRDLSFKFLRSQEAIFLRSSKYGDRSASGKFITIYPRNDEELRSVLLELGELLEGRTGPSILSDVRWGKGPLYVRFGAFHLRSMRTDTGEHVWAIEDPDGRLVPDQRRPGFHPPEWVELPELVQQAVAERSLGSLSGFPYRPVRALHFSNGGGVYVAVDADGNEVLMKEARPLAGLDGNGSDAVDRLAGEAWAYEALEDLSEIPALIDHRIGHEHYFLVRELVDGTSLVHVARSRNPLLRGGSTQEEFAAYAEWALGTVERVEKVLRQMHDRGVVFGDLHPSNILVTAQGGIVFIDLEGAFGLEEDRAQALGAPGYIAPETFRGAEIDDYALAVLTLDLFVPLARIISWDSDKARDLIGFIERWFPVPESFADRVLEGLRLEAPRFLPGTDTKPLAALGDLTESPWPAHAVRAADVDDPDGDDVDCWLDTARELGRFIGSTATPERTDRLYPGDPRQFMDDAGGTTFAYGAAGVLWSLAECGVEIPEAHTSWLRTRAHERDWSRPGFGDGVAGVALTLGVLGELEAASAALDRACSLIDRWTGPSIHDGLAGIGLAALDLDRAAPGQGFGRVADQMVDRLFERPVPDSARHGEPGLWRGETGPALLLVRQFERSGDHSLLDTASALLLRDLATLDSLAVDDAQLIDRLPLLASGSGGVAVVAHRVLRHREVPQLVELRDRVRIAATMPFVDEAGLFYGHAGLMTVLGALGDGGRVPTSREVVAHARNLRLHSVGVKGSPATVGRFALRLSTDFATGSAGVMLALQAMAGQARMPLL